jgi:hypothetical protein
MQVKKDPQISKNQGNVKNHGISLYALPLIAIVRGNAGKPCLYIAHER